ncbi:hypothetical protein HPB52_019346 [Rhipicephalus sanguineus]|uniref:Uncharacterized protein n=1 Tax=Rhipicephalus sanguineus TaxID=34632 RepID=A0A9D4PGD0_RHISA|nr:hypothetical protein HPB52_019346 [Rhipicephalus sanguineus]
MAVDLMPPRIQRFGLKLMCFQCQVFYVPDKLLSTADTLSLHRVDGIRWNLLTGRGTVQKVERYDIAAQKWYTAPQINTSCSASAACVVRDIANHGR